MAHANRRTTIHEGEHIELIRGDGLAWLEDCRSDSLDAVITDPPYGFDSSYDWDQPVDASLFFELVTDAVHEDGFVAFFGQLPRALPWLNAAKATGWDMLEHVSWVKRSSTPMHRISRGHEEVFIYGRNNRSFYETEGPWEDVKLPMVRDGCVSMEALDRYIKALRAKARGEDQTRVRGDAGYDYGSDGKKYPAGSETDRAPLEANFTNVWSFGTPTQRDRGDGRADYHPTEKPVAVNERLVKMLIPEGGHVADPFCGRASLPVAAMNVGRKASGVEISERWSEAARERVCRMQKDLFKHAP